MSDSREESPDWLRSFQPTTQPAIFLSSGSESPLSCSPVSDDDEDSIKLSNLFKKKVNEVPDIKEHNNQDERDAGANRTECLQKYEEKIKLGAGRKRKNNDDDEEKGDEQSGKVVIVECKTAKSKKRQKHKDRHEQNHTVFSLSSDSEPEGATPIKKDEVVKKELVSTIKAQFVDNDSNMDSVVVHKTDAEFPKFQDSKMKSPAKILKNEDDKTSTKEIIDNITNEENDANNVVKDDDKNSIHTARKVSSSRLPLLLSEKVQYSKTLVECEGDSIDLSGDVGAVGRIVISHDHSENQSMLLDLKGTIYRTTIVPSRTFCVVSFGQSEAKIEAIMNDYIQLQPQSNVYEAETMVEGTLDGFSLDSEDEPDNNLPKPTAQGDQDGATEEQITGKAKRKARETVVGGKNKGKSVGGKLAKKVKKKPQVTKKSKSRK